MYYPNCKNKVQKACVCLLHYGDLEEILAIDVLRSAELVVYYGGSGEPDPRWKEDLPEGNKGKERIWRKIDREGIGALTSREANQLIAYAKSLSKGDKVAKPAFLEPSRKRNTLIALCILCQGYLAINGSENVDAKRASWLMPESGCKKDVDCGAWWLNILCEDEDERKQSSIKSAKKLMECVVKEWVGTKENLKPVETLIESIVSESISKDGVLAALTAIEGSLRDQNGIGSQGPIVQ